MRELPREVRERFRGSPEQDAIALVGQPPRFFDSVRLEDYDPAWPSRFRAAAALLEQQLDGVAIGVEHVGSTSVPGWPPGPSSISTSRCRTPRKSPLRHRLFRDWLRAHPEDRRLYEVTKRRLAERTADAPSECSLAKTAGIDRIYERIFAVVGLDDVRTPTSPRDSPDLRRTVGRRGGPAP
jgi:hypothetical protein